jgi:hypothetical protein
MASLSISNKMVERYFGYLRHLDSSSKKKLISKLTESLEVKSDKKFDIESIFGAWEDNRTSDEIIREIKCSRVEKKNTPDL